MIRRPRRRFGLRSAVVAVMVLGGPVACQTPPTNPEQQCSASRSSLNRAQQEMVLALYDTMSMDRLSSQPVRIHLAAASVELEQGAVELSDPDLRGAFGTAARKLRRQLQAQDIMAGGRELRRLETVIELECGR